MKIEGSRSKAFLLKGLRTIQANPNEHYSIGLVDDDLYKWHIIIFGPQGTLYENGIFKAVMKFPLQYPEEPPEFVFTTEMYHPNIEKNGKVCISILHSSGEDIFGYELLSERWMPVRTPESVILSVLTLLNEPNCESPANLDAAMLLIKDVKEYEKKVRRLAQKSVDEE